MVGHNHTAWKRSTLGRELPAYREHERGPTPVMRLRTGGCLRLVAGRPDGLWQWAVYPAAEGVEPGRSAAWGVEESRELAMGAAAGHVPLDHPREEAPPPPRNLRRA